MRILLFLVMAASLHAAPLTIVENGTPRAVIIAAPEPHAQRAAQDIQKYVEKISGAKLPIQAEGGAIQIYVGHTDAAKKAGVKIPTGFDPTIRRDAFEEEGYVLKTVGNQIFIAGNSDGPYQGTLYAAYAFLEKLGCRWYFPGAWGEIVPAQKTITVSDLDVTSHPDFAVRQVWLSGWITTSKEEGAQYIEWGTKIGFSSGEFYPTCGDGFLALPLSPSIYYEKNPEFYAMDQGGNRKPPIPQRTGKFDDRWTMLCLSNPDMFTEYVKNVRAHFAGEKKIRAVGQNGIGISPPDGKPFCYCDKCLAANQNFDYPTHVAERMQSEEYFGFTVKVAKEFPDKWIATMAYSNREMPPQGVKLLPNMSVKYAPISCCVLHPNNDPSCWRRIEMMQILKQYCRQTPHFVIRDYNPGFLTGVFLPEREMANSAINIPLYKAAGVKGMQREGRKVFMQTWLSYYITGKLLWDSKTDVAALKKEFYETFFGEKAGPHVQAWWDEYEAALGSANVHIHEDWLVNHVVNLDLTKKLRRHVEAAGKAQMTDAQRKRYEAFALIAEHVEAYAAMHEADRLMDFPKAAAESQRMLDLKNKLNGMWSFFYTFGERREQRPSFTAGHVNYYKRVVSMTTGTNGTLVAPLPLETKFTRDTFNAGVPGEWYAPAFDDSRWGTKNTFYLWEQQDQPETSAGHDWDGYGWYRATLDVPATFAGKPLHFFLGGAINEAWVWVNGEYAGHRGNKLWWARYLDFDLDVTPLAKPGKNTIAIRIHNNTELGGLYRRGFLWSPTAAVKLKTDTEPETPPAE